MKIMLDTELTKRCETEDTISSKLIEVSCQKMPKVQMNSLYIYHDNLIKKTVIII